MEKGKSAEKGGEVRLPKKPDLALTLFLFEEAKGLDNQKRFCKIKYIKQSVTY